MSTSRAAYGTLLKRRDGTTVEGFTNIDGVSELTGPGLTAEQIDVTHHTTVGNYRSIVPSFLSAGDVTFTLFFDPDDAQHEGVLSDFESRVRRNWQIVFPGATSNETYDFAAYVTGFEISAPVDGALTASVTLGIDQEVTRS